jgi:hypothetical protein
LPNLKGPILIISVICISFVLGYKQDTLFSELRSMWATWKPLAQSDDTITKQTPGAIQQIPLIEQRQSSTQSPNSAFYKKPEPQHGEINKIESLESVTPGSVQPRQEMQRNLYFEKLSEQLRELRGEPPSPATNASQSIGNPPNTHKKEADEELQEPDESTPDDQESEGELIPDEPEE